MKFSIVSVYPNKTNPTKIDGWWLQNCIGDLNKAKKAADDTLKANGGKGTYSVVKEINGPCGFYDNLTPLYITR